VRCVDGRSKRNLREAGGTRWRSVGRLVNECPFSTSTVRSSLPNRPVLRLVANSNRRIWRCETADGDGTRAIGPGLQRSEGDFSFQRDLARSRRLVG